MRLVSLLVLSTIAVPLDAGPVAGTVEVLGRGGRRDRRADLDQVVVYLEGVARPPTPVTATINMRRKEFEPRVIAIPVGGTVEFPNEDPILHNVFSVSEENAFDLDLYKKPEVGRATFGAPGVVRVYCNIHPQMSAVVVVRDNDFFAVADRSGAFRIEGVPPGRYTLKAWHERAEEGVAVEVTVPEQGGAGVGTLTLDSSGYRRARHKNKYGKDYDRDKY